MSVTNDVTTTANTGGNSASYSTLGGTIHTGNATNLTQVKTTGNINTTSVTAGPAGAGNNGSNDTTGPLSENRNTIDNKTYVDVKNDNTAVVNNRVNSDSNTGENNADYNTGPSLVQTGSALNATNVYNHVKIGRAHV